MHFFLFLFFNNGFIQIRFCFCFMSNKYYLMLLSLRRYLFSVKTIFYWWETYALKFIYYSKSISWKKMPRKLYFMKCSKENFHSVSLPKKFFQCVGVFFYSKSINSIVWSSYELRRRRYLSVLTILSLPVNHIESFLKLSPHLLNEERPETTWNQLKPLESTQKLPETSHTIVFFT